MFKLVALIFFIAIAVCWLSGKSEGFHVSPYTYSWHPRYQTNYLWQQYNPNFHMGYMNDFYAPANCMDTLFGGVRCYPWNWWQYWYL